MINFKLKNLNSKKNLAILTVVLLLVFGALAMFSGNISVPQNDKISNSIQKEDSVIKFISSKKDFKSGEDPELKFHYQKEDKGAITAIGESLGVSNDEKKIKATAKIINPMGETREATSDEIIENNGDISVKLKNSKGFKPGLYKVILEVDDQGVKKEITQDFTMGVLAINVNKSIYLPEEKAYLQMGVLDDKGKTICSANLVLSIKYKVLSDETVLSTENGMIEYSGKCHGDNVTDVPDYFAYYQVGEAGTYEMKLTNLDNGYEITDSFEVRKSVPFEVERIGPTRIWPMAPYEMVLKIKANENFEGNIIETVPEGFVVTNVSSSVIARSDSDAAIPLEESSQAGFTQSMEPTGPTGIITWQVDLKKGENIELKYNFDAPDISPYVYLLGPLKIGDFKEIRQWQIASDATLSYVGGAEASGASASYNVALNSLSGGSGSAALEGDLVIVSTGFSQFSNGNPGVSTTGYTEVADLYANDDSDANFSVNWKIMGSTPDTSVTCNGSGLASSSAVTVVHVWRGADQTTPLDVTSTTATGSNSSIPNSPPITPVTSGAVVIATGLGAMGPNDNSVTAPSGYANQIDISTDYGWAAIVGSASKAWTSGTEDPAVWTDWTTSANDSWAAVTLAIRPAIITVSGNVYTDKGTTPYDCSANNLTIGVSVNGGTTATGTCTLNTGAFSITTGVSSAAGDPVVVFIDSAETPKGTTVTLVDDIYSDIIGLHIYQNRVIVRHENAGPMTNAKMATGDNADAGIRYSVASGALTTESGMELHIWTGDSFTPGGAVTTQGAGGNLHLDTGATLTAPSTTLTVSGNYSNSGTFTHNSGTVTFNGATTQTITGANTWNNLTINNTYASPDDTYDVDPDAIQTVAGTLTVTDGQWSSYTGDDYADVSIGAAGILKPDASASITVSGNYSNSGTFTHNSGTIAFNLWNYKKQITVNNQVASALTNYQVKIIVDPDTGDDTGDTVYCDGKCQTAGASGYGDIRFTDSSGDQIDYWVEDTTANPASFWVEVPSIPASSTATIYMLYGNSGATTTSNGDNTFEFFDDFTDGSSKWDGVGTTTVDPEGYVYATKTGTGSVISTLTSKTGEIGSGDFKVTLKIKSSGSEAHASCDYAHELKKLVPAETTIEDGAYTNYTSKSYDILSGTDVKLKLYAYAMGYTDGGSCDCDGDEYCEIECCPNEADCNTQAGCEFCGAIWTDSNYSANATVYADDVYVRKYIATEPTKTWGSETETGGTKTLSGAMTSSSGFNNLTFNSANGSWTFGANSATVANDLTITAGTVTASSETLTITGNFSNSGTFTHNSGTVSFDGSTTQTLTGATTWNNLTINNTYASPDDDNDVDPGAIQTVAGTLTVTDGQWSSYMGDDYTVVSIGANGIMKPDTSASITVSGNYSNTGTFTYNSGTVTFDGSGTQQVNAGGTAANKAFNNLTHSGSGTLQLVTTGIDINGTFSQTAGTFDANSLNQNYAGDFSLSLGTTYTKGGTLTFDGVSQTVTDSTAGIQDLGVITIGPSTTTSVSTAVNMRATDLTIGADDTLDISSDTLYVSGNYTNSNILTSTGSTIDFTGSGTQQVNAGGTAANKAFNNLTHSGAGTVQLTATGIDVNGTFSQTAGTFDANSLNQNYAGDFSLSLGTTYTKGGTLTFDGDLTYTDSTSPKQDIGTVVIGASPDTTDLASDMTATSLIVTATDFFYTNGYDLNIGTGGISISGTFDATDDVETDTTFINTEGSFAINSGATFVQDQSTLTFDGTSGTVDLITDGSFSLYNLILNDGVGSLTVEVEDSLTIANDLTITGGTLDTVSAENNSITVGGNLTNNDIFTANSGTVTFDDNTKTSHIYGDTTFNNFTCATAGKTLQFEATKTTTVTGTLTFTGTSGTGNLIMLRSTVDNTQWKIDPQGARDVSYVNVKDSNNINVTEIFTTSSIDGGNNINWDFPVVNVFYSVGQNGDDYSSGGNVSIASGIASFTVAQTAVNLGVGDRLVAGGNTYYLVSKTDTTHWDVVTKSGTVPSDLSLTVVTSISHEYTSLSAAIVGAIDANHLNTTNLVSGNFILNLPCYYDDGPDGTAVTIDGYTTGADNYIKIYTPNDTSTEANAVQRHRGKWNEGKYRLTNLFQINEENVRIDGLQISALDNTVVGTTINTTADLRMSNNIFQVTATAGSNSGIALGLVAADSVARVWNNIIYFNDSSKSGDYGINKLAGSGTAYVYNNTVYNVNSGIAQTAGTVVVKNNIFYNNVVDYSGTFDSSSTHNLSKDGTAPAYGTYYANATVAFVDVTSGNENFHLIFSDTGARDRGTDQISEIGFTTDIDGQTRAETWDIGADEMIGVKYKAKGTIKLKGNVKFK